MRTRKKWTTRKSRKCITEKSGGRAESTKMILRLALGRISLMTTGG
jgi:hypothetical protein